jgi:hypothetical protein
MSYDNKIFMWNRLNKWIAKKKNDKFQDILFLSTMIQRMILKQGVKLRITI